MSTLDEKPRFPWISGATLVVSNLVPLWFVLFRGWDVFLVIFLFWCENVITGIINVFRMAVCTNETVPPGTPPIRVEGPGGDKFVSTATKVFAIPFFIMHYGMFTFCHGLFVFTMFGEFARASDELNIRELTQCIIPALALLGSHVVSFFLNFIGQEEYRKTTVQKLMARPYGRVVALHITIVLGGVGIAAGGEQLSNWGIDPRIFPLILLLGIKIFFDFAMHVNERKKLAGPLPVARVAGTGDTEEPVTITAAAAATSPHHIPKKALWIMGGVLAFFLLCGGVPALMGGIYMAFFQPDEVTVQPRSTPQRAAPAVQQPKPRPVPNRSIPAVIERPATTPQPAPVAQDTPPATSARRPAHERLYENLSYEEVNTLLGITGQRKRAIRRRDETRITYEWRLEDADVVVLGSFENDRLLSWKITDTAEADAIDEAQWRRRQQRRPGAPGGPSLMRPPAPPPPQQ